MLYGCEFHQQTIDTKCIYHRLVYCYPRCLQTIGREISNRRCVRFNRIRKTFSKWINSKMFSFSGPSCSHWIISSTFTDCLMYNHVYVAHLDSIYVSFWHFFFVAHSLSFLFVCLRFLGVCFLHYYWCRRRAELFCVHFPNWIKGKGTQAHIRSVSIQSKLKYNCRDFVRCVFILSPLFSSPPRFCQTILIKVMGVSHSVIIITIIIKFSVCPYEIEEKNVENTQQRAQL